MWNFKFIKALILGGLTFFPAISWAKASMGDFANDALQPVLVLADFVGTTSLIVGGCSLFSAVIRYRQYRVNPLAHPISSVITLFLIGFVLLVLPFSYMVSGDTFSYKFFNLS